MVHPDRETVLALDVEVSRGRGIDLDAGIERQAVRRLAVAKGTGFHRLHGPVGPAALPLSFAGGIYYGIQRTSHV
jgi:hypothetical protein